MVCILRLYFRGGTRLFAGGALEVQQIPKLAYGLSIGLPQSSWLCGKRSKRGHPQFAAQILMTSGLRRANVATRECEAGRCSKVRQISERCSMELFRSTLLPNARVLYQLVSFCSLCTCIIFKKRYKLLCVSMGKR